MNRIHYSAQSQRDMDNIWDHIAEEYQTPSAAAALIDSIASDIDQLADYAELGPPLSSIADVESDYRFLVTRNYLTFYRTSGSDVYIDRVLYGRMNYLRILFPNLEDEEKVM